MVGGVELNQRTCDGTCDYETFLFDRIIKDREEAENHPGKYFDCCKTAYRPYDLAVNIFLIIAKHYLGDKIGVKSDGDLSQWKDALEIVKESLSYNDFSFGVVDPPKTQPIKHKEFYTANGWKGEQYEKTKDLPLKEIAQRIKKEALDKYPQIKLSVITDHYSMGCSIDVRVKEVSFKLLDPEETRKRELIVIRKKHKVCLKRLKGLVTNTDLVTVTE